MWIERQNKQIIIIIPLMWSFVLQQNEESVAKSIHCYWKKSKDFKMFFIAFCLLNYLLPCCNMLAQPKGFTDDPYVNDEKFIEKGNSIHNG